LVTKVTAAMSQVQPKNFIIDGDFTQWPEGDRTGISHGQYGAAMWKHNISGGELVADLKETADVPTFAESGHTSVNCMHYDVTTAETAVAAGDYGFMEYSLTGTDHRQLFGKEITISFWHKHTKTGIFSVGIKNEVPDRSYTFEYTQTTTNTWEKHTETLTLDTTGTWNFTETGRLRFAFVVFTGSTHQTTTDVWTAGNFWASPNQVNGADNAANDFKIAQVGLYLGPTAPTFTGEAIATVKDQVDYYIQRYNYNNVANEWVCNGCSNTNTVQGYFHLRRMMRSNPTITATAAGTFIHADLAVGVVCTSIAFNQPSRYGFRFETNSGGSLTNHSGAYITRNASSTAFLNFDSRH
jgi:hypothetical protein